MVGVGSCRTDRGRLLCSTGRLWNLALAGSRWVPAQAGRSVNMLTDATARSKISYQGMQPATHTVVVSAVAHSTVAWVVVFRGAAVVSGVVAVGRHFEGNRQP